MRQVKVKSPFGLNTDAGEAITFGPGETVPREYAGHWWVQANVAQGNAVETDDEYEEDEEGDLQTQADGTVKRGRGRPSKASIAAQEAAQRAEADATAARDAQMTEAQAQAARDAQAKDATADAKALKAREAAVTEANEREAERMRTASAAAPTGATVGPVKSAG